MGRETFALINNEDQVVNHILVDKEASDFEEVMNGQLAHWGCVRYVETTENDLVDLFEDPKIWTTHTEETGFVAPPRPVILLEDNRKPSECLPGAVRINGRIYPPDSLLIKENAHLRPDGWDFAEGVKEVSLEDAELTW